MQDIYLFRGASRACLAIVKFITFLAGSKSADINAHAEYHASFSFSVADARFPGRSYSEK